MSQMQAAGGWARLAHAIPSLADFPAMDVAFSAAEAPAFPSLGWQQPAARSAVMALAGIGTWLRVNGNPRLVQYTMQLIRTAFGPRRRRHLAAGEVSIDIG